MKGPVTEPSPFGRPLRWPEANTTFYVLLTLSQGRGLFTLKVFSAEVIDSLYLQLFEWHSVLGRFIEVVHVSLKIQISFSWMTPNDVVFLWGVFNFPSILLLESQ